MLCKFMLHWIIGNLYASCIITEKRCGASHGIPKSANKHPSHTISEVVVANAQCGKPTALGTPFFIAKCGVV